MTAFEVHDGFRFLVRDDPSETGHTAPIRLPRLRTGFALAGDVLLAVARAFVTRLLVTVSALAVVVGWLAFAQQQGGDTPAAVVMVIVGFLGICGVMGLMLVREVKRLNAPVRRRRKEEAVKP